MVPAWCHSNVNFAILRNIPFLIHWEAVVNDHSVIDIVYNRHITWIEPQSQNRFQIFSCRFRLTGAQKICTGIPRNYFDRVFHERTFMAKIVQKQTEIYLYSSCPLSWIFYAHSRSTVYVYISAPFHLRLQLACMVFFKRELCQRNIPMFIQWDREESVRDVIQTFAIFFGIFRSWSNEKQW